VLGGVAAGIANYFGVSVVSIRILFVLFILLGGAGFFVYIVLWIIVPPAKTVTEKLEMKGEPVTLENIENNIKGGLRMNPEEDESIFTKILLFPFRLMAEVIGILGRIASPFFRFLLEVIRVAAGVFIILMSLGFLYALVVAIALWAGAEGWWMLPFWWEDARITLSNDLNWMVIRDTLTFWIAIPAFVAGLIPVLFYMLLGVAALAKRWVARPLVGWSLFGIWVLSLITLAISVPRFWYEFREEGDDITTTTLPALQDRTMTIMADGFQTNGEIDLVDLYIYPTDDPELRLERKVHTRGRDNDNIKENAAMVLYDVSVNDSVLTIPREIAFAEGAVFRGQEVDISLYIPKGQAFYLDKNLRGLLSYRRRFDSGLGHTYLFDEDGRRLCVDCEQPYPESASERRQGIEYRIGSEGRALNMELEEFDELILRGNISVVLEQGEENRLEVAAGSDPRSLNVRLVEDRLYVEQEEETYGRGLEVILNATDFTGLVLEEQVEADLVSFVGEDLEVVVANSSVLNGALEVGALEVRVEDEARIRLTGSAKALNLTARDRSSFRSYELYAEDADVDATHRAEVRLRATQALTVNSSSDITVRYRGNPESVNVRGKVREVEEE
ncbi:MAG TPA: hypothetical protein DCP28_25410, partial [Cytophagales bacterium]|nr:hypothetical protein [Cytophagales bacterium]